MLKLYYGGASYCLPRVEMLRLSCFESLMIRMSDSILLSELGLDNDVGDGSTAWLGRVLKPSSWQGAMSVRCLARPQRPSFNRETHIVQRDAAHVQ